MSQYRVRGTSDSKMPSRVNINGQIVSIPHSSTIASFVDSLSNPELPTRCSVFYAGANVVFVSYPECAEELRRTNPEIFATAIQFLSHFRSDEKVASIAQPVCNCPKDSHWWVHDVAQHWPSTTLEAGSQLFDSMCSIAHSGLMNTKEVGFTCPWPTIEKLVKSSDKSLKATGRATWPTKYTDVFGDNPQLIVHMLWSIFNQFPDAYNPLFLLYSLVRMSRLTVMAALARILGWARQLVDHANQALDVNLQLRRYLGKFDLLIEFMDETRLAFGRGGDMAIYRAWHLSEGREREDVVLFASRALCMDTFKDSYDLQAEKLVFIGTFFYEICDTTSVFGFNIMGEEWPPLSPRIVTKPYNPFTKYLEDPGLIKTDACEKIYKMASFNGCAAPNCFALKATLDRKLQACSACHVVRYCSPECQHAAWKHVEIPHRPICRLLSTITKKLGIEWRKFTHPDQQALLQKNVERLTVKEAQDIKDLELRMSTWRMLARAKPTEESSSDVFKKVMNAMNTVQELQRMNAAK
ncbi:hypothetical protein CYLTODRAFT_414000 [Cylindrobasidium torrendii FP15055 ss-10]|uniref:MYND-type domain-containing protein n=1 Tax=Cylindrobasidium torrendii FP15055 ss-10 TaxID=1314674 RepID=A0A0D7AYR3_9AGAR|nr:hypothetical protein CYLTODRAFT_414000 [Cylindrobasidium torrendii FP15055 ss-10]